MKALSSGRRSLGEPSLSPEPGEGAPQGGPQAGGTFCPFS